MTHRLPILGPNEAAHDPATGSAPGPAAAISPLEGLLTPLPGTEASVAPEELLQVGDLAQRTGKTVRALHLYEELGLLRPHARSKGRFRLYGPDALLRVRWIGKLQEMGLSLNAIAELLKGFHSAESAANAMHQVRAVFETRLAETRVQLERLRALETELESSLHYLDVCGVCDPARHTGHCTRCDLHSNEAPELVLGVQNG